MPSPSQDYRLIPLTQGQFAKVDAEDYERVSTKKWCAQKSQKGFRAVRNERIDGKVRTILMHRFVMEMHPDNTLQVDHINHDTLDNRRDNLRLATSAENLRNKRTRVDSKSQYKGVYWHKRDGWSASICVNRRRIWLGTRPTPRQAFEDLYIPAAIKYHGEFACYER